MKETQREVTVYRCEFCGKENHYKVAVEICEKSCAETYALMDKQKNCHHEHNKYEIEIEREQDPYDDDTYFEVKGIKTCHNCGYRAVRNIPEDKLNAFAEQLFNSVYEEIVNEKHDSKSD